MRTIGVLRNGIIPLLLGGLLGVWPMTAAAGLLPQQPKADDAKDAFRFIYLTDISYSMRRQHDLEATLYDRLENKTTRLHTLPGSARFEVKDAKGKVLLQGTVTHISRRAVIFRVEDKLFAIQVGQNLQEALQKPLTNDEVDALKQDKRTPGTAPKTGFIAFEVRNKPWTAVLEWLSEQTGLPVVANQTPRGTLTFMPPGPSKARSLGEVMDILNEALTQQKLLLLRREQSIALVPTDAKIDPSLVPRIAVKDLAARGNTELVSVVVPLRKVRADEIAGEVEKLLGPLGKVVALARLNQLVLQDAAGNLRSILQTLEALEGKEAQRSGKEKGLAVEFRARPWRQVLEWLTEVTGLPVYAPSVPTGTVTIISPRGKTYTIPEIIDLLNDVLAPQKYGLIRLEEAYSLIPIDEKIDEHSLRRVRPEDLEKHANREIVSVVVPLTSVSAKDLKGEVEKLLGPDGKAVAMEKANALIIRDRVATLKRIVQTIKEIDVAGKS